MYSRKAWGGNVNPYIIIKFIHQDIPEDQDPLVSLVMFEWQDKDLIGKPTPAGGDVSIEPRKRLRLGRVGS